MKILIMIKKWRVGIKRINSILINKILRMDV